MPLSFAAQLTPRGLLTEAKKVGQGLRRV